MCLPKWDSSTMWQDGLSFGTVSVSSVFDSGLIWGTIQTSCRQPQPTAKLTAGIAHGGHVILVSLHYLHPSSLSIFVFLWVRISKLINHGWWWGGTYLNEMIWDISLWQKKTLDSQTIGNLLGRKSCSPPFPELFCFWSWCSGTGKWKVNGQDSCRQSQTALSATDKRGSGGGGRRGKREQSISKVESQSQIIRPAPMCLENVTGLSEGGGDVTFQFTSYFIVLTVAEGWDWKEGLHWSLISDGFSPL